MPLRNEPLSLRRLHEAKTARMSTKNSLTGFLTGFLTSPLLDSLAAVALPSRRCQLLRSGLLRSRFHERAT